jgi:hypothetical protein
MKIVINRCFGGYGLSEEAVKKLAAVGCPAITVKDKKCFVNYHHEIRNNPYLIAVIEELGAAADGKNARLKVIEIPDDVNWEISDFDGMETIHEKHREWS